MDKAQRCPTLFLLAHEASDTKDAIAQRLFLKFLRFYSAEDSDAFEAAAAQAYRAAEALMKARAEKADR